MKTMLLAILAVFFLAALTFAGATTTRRPSTKDRIKSFVARQGESINLNCPANHVIMITEAYVSADNEGSRPLKQTGCTNNDVLRGTGNECNNKRTCFLRTQDTDPTKKSNCKARPLKINYKCNTSTGTTGRKH